MKAKDVIRNTINTSHEVLSAYLNDLADAELMIRPAPGANHIAWQLGHMIEAEHQMIAQSGYTMPDLPDELAGAYTPESSKSDDAGKFHKKDQYLEWMARQREATLANLDAMPDAELDKATPESMRSYAPTVGSAFNMIGVHELMHAGQFVAVRRRLGKPVTI